MGRDKKLDRSIKVEALDVQGRLLPGVTFKFYLEGKLFGSAEGGHGYAFFQLPEPSPKKVEIEGVFRGEKIRKRVSVNADCVQLHFDPDKKPPPLPDKVIHKDDPHRGRWRGLAEEGGRRLTAVLCRTWKKEFEFDLAGC